MYKKCHNAIKENAKNQNCKKLLKLIELAEYYGLLFLYAYNKKFPATLKDPEKYIKYIEIIDPVLLKKLDIKVTLIKSSERLSILYENKESTRSLNFKQNKIFIKRLQSIDIISQLLNKFDLDDLPKL